MKAGLHEVKRVLHVIPSIAARHGGPSIMLEQVARGLYAQGIEVHIAATDDDGEGRLDVSRGEPTVRDGITYWFFKRQTHFYKVSRPLGSWLAKNVSDYDFVHIHALFSYSSVAAARCARRVGVPYAVRPLGTLNRWGMENRRPLLKQLSFRFIEQPILENAAFVHFTSEQELKEAAELGGSIRSEVIPNPAPRRDGGTTTVNFRNVHPQLAGRRIILFLSRFDRKKGLELLLPAFARVRNRIPDAVLVLAGSGDSEFTEGLRATAAKLGIAADVFWPGFLRGDIKEAALRDADVFVLPSRSENFGIAVVEAMAAGCAVVVSDQVAIHSDIERAGAGLVVPCEVERLEQAICQVLEDDSARRSMGLNGKCLTQTQYSIESVTSRLITAYNAALSRSLS